MNTFLPYKDFDRSAQSLDDLRLNKQVLEVSQMLRLLFVSEGSPYRYHPAVCMWEGYEQALRDYGIACATELRTRRKKWHKETAYFQSLQYLDTYNVMPPWLGHPWFHVNNRKALLWKDEDHYSGKFTATQVPKSKPAYVWPVLRPRWRESGDNLFVFKKIEVKVSFKTEYTKNVQPGFPDFVLTSLCRVGDGWAKYLLCPHMKGHNGDQN